MKHTLPLLIGLLVFAEAKTVYINPDEATRSRIAVEELMLGGIKGRNKPIIQEEPNPYQFLFDDN